MFTPLTRTYLFGYTRQVSSEANFLGVSGDDEVAELFHRMTVIGVSPNDWVFWRQVIKCAYRLFNTNARTWFAEQAENDGLTQNARDFLNDTVTFVNTGKRPAMIGSRVRIIRRELGSDASRSRGAILPFDVGYGEDMKILGNWVRHNGGLIDLLHTLNVLFGETS